MKYKYIMNYFDFMFLLCIFFVFFSFVVLVVVGFFKKRNDLIYLVGSVCC